MEYIQDVSVSKKKKVGLGNSLDIEAGRTKADIKYKGPGRTAKLNHDTSSVFSKHFLYDSIS